MQIMYHVRLFARNVMRRRLFSLINLTGLAFGIAFVLLIGQYLYFEFNYNRSFPNIDRIYRLVDAKDHTYWLDYRVRDAVVEKISGVKNACLVNRRSAEVNQGDHVFELENLYVVDPAFFEIFGFPFLQGSAENALQTLESVVLTESTARKIFGTTNVVGQELVLDHQFDMVVTGIVQDLPPNSSFRTDLFISAENVKRKGMRSVMDCLRYDGKDDSQCKYLFNIFVELQEHAEAASVAQHIPSLFAPDDYRYPDEVQLSPFKTNYFYTQLSDHLLPHANLDLVKILSGIGLIILALAVINYVNLTTAGYKYRLTEIGVKKCLGVDKRMLKTQLLIESLLFCACAALLGIVIAEIFAPVFSRFVGKPLPLLLLSDWHFSLAFVGFIFFLGLTAGFMPAVLLTRISALQLFQSGSLPGSSGALYRNILSVLQFGITIALICWLLVISKQIDYAKHRDLGFNTEQLLYLRIDDKLADRISALTDRLKQFNGMKSLTLTNGIPGKINVRMSGYATIIIDSSTVKTFGFKILQGRNTLPGDLNKACLVNAAALGNFENGNFIGQKVSGIDVVGVVSDFHFTSMHEKLQPLVLIYNDWDRDYITMRIVGQVGEAMKYIKNAWMAICPDFPFELQFYDDAFAAMYRQEENQASIVRIFTILAVVISCLGIFGMAVFQAEQRTKEIGIRKVLGATAIEITTMLTQNLTKWVFMANFIAWPVAWYFASQWLQRFAYRTEIDWWVFALAGTLALLIALLTVSTQAIRAALMNPVESLRRE